MTDPGTILVVDDLPANRKLLTDLLLTKGYDVLAAASGEEALAIVDNERPGLVLLDVLMPGLTGYDVCRKIRENPATAHVPIVLVTSLDPAEERIKGIEAGADDFLTRPVNQAELLARVRSLLRIRALHDQVQAQSEQLADWNRTLEQRVQEHLAQLHSLLEVSQLLTSSLEIDELLRLILATVSRLMHADTSSVLLVDPATGDLVYRVPVGPAGEHLQELRLKAGEGVVGWVVKEKRPALVNDAQRDARVHALSGKLAVAPPRSILAVPLMDRERVIGAIEVLNTTRPREFTQHDLDLLTGLAAHASVALRNARLITSIKEENRSLQDELQERYRTVIGTSAPMQQAVTIARRAAGTAATVLLLGESGVGKEVFARSIHRWSQRVDKPFMAVNCVALSDHLLESELFGHEKGAFTGAHQQKKGLFELANGGTVFLDEIGDMKPDLQAKLLRVLQDHSFERVGGSQTIRVDIRIIAATNHDLEEDVQAGRFRQDLFFRLNVITLTLPPLRERREDIPALARFFIDRHCRALGRLPMTLSKEALSLLARHAWPGNVRELENVMERAVALAPEDEIGAADLLLGRTTFRQPRADDLLDLPFHESLEGHKESLVRHALAKAQGRKGEAAKLLNIHPTYLSRLCRQYSID